MASTTTAIVQIAAAIFKPLILLMVLAPIMGLFLAYWAARRLDGGLTGDLYGALCEVVEVLVLLIVVLLP